MREFELKVLGAYHWRSLLVFLYLLAPICPLEPYSMWVSPSRLLPETSSEVIFKNKEIKRKMQPMAIWENLWNNGYLHLVNRTWRLPDSLLRLWRSINLIFTSYLTSVLSEAISCYITSKKDTFCPHKVNRMQRLWMLFVALLPREEWGEFVKPSAVFHLCAEYGWHRERILSTTLKAMVSIFDILTHEY